MTCLTGIGEKEKEAFDPEMKTNILLLTIILEIERNHDEFSLHDISI